MTFKKSIFAVSFLLWAVSCGKVAGVNDTRGSFDPDLVEKATDQFCTKGQQLQELVDGTETSFSQLNYRSTIFAFSGKSDENGCLIASAVNETWAENGASLWFSLNPIDNCLKNNSIWDVRQAYSSGFGHYYSMVAVGDPTQRVMNMNAHGAVSGTYVQERVGLRILTCK